MALLCNATQQQVPSLDNPYSAFDMPSCARFSGSCSHFLATQERVSCTHCWLQRAAPPIVTSHQAYSHQWVLSAGSSIAIEGVSWGRQGPFAMNIWVKQFSNNGNMFQYVISTRNRTLSNVTDDSIFYPNQVNLNARSINGFPGEVATVAAGLFKGGHFHSYCDSCGSH